MFDIYFISVYKLVAICRKYNGSRISNFIVICMHTLTQSWYTDNWTYSCDQKFGAFRKKIKIVMPNYNSIQIDKTFIFGL